MNLSNKFVYLKILIFEFELCVLFQVNNDLCTLVKKEILQDLAVCSPVKNPAAFFSYILLDLVDCLFYWSQI